MDRKVQGNGKATAVGDSHDDYRLIDSTGPRKRWVPKVIKESDGTLIHSRERRLARQAVGFREQ